jgi:hypothetical protein
MDRDSLHIQNVQGLLDYDDMDLSGFRLCHCGFSSWLSGFYTPNKTNKILENRELCAYAAGGSFVQV